MKTLSDVCKQDDSKPVLTQWLADRFNGGPMIYLLTYHTCQQEYVSAWIIGHGFPFPGFSCPACGATVHDSDDLRYDFGRERLSVLNWISHKMRLNLYFDVKLFGRRVIQKKRYRCPLATPHRGTKRKSRC